MKTKWQILKTLLLVVSAHLCFSMATFAQGQKGDKHTDHLPLAIAPSG